MLVLNLRLDGKEKKSLSLCLCLKVWNKMERKVVLKIVRKFRLSIVVSPIQFQNKSSRLEAMRHILRSKILFVW